MDFVTIIVFVALALLIQEIERVCFSRSHVLSQSKCDQEFAFLIDSLKQVNVMIYTGKTISCTLFSTGCGYFLFRSTHKQMRLRSFGTRLLLLVKTEQRRQTKKTIYFVKEFYPLQKQVIMFFQTTVADIHIKKCKQRWKATRSHKLLWRMRCWGVILRQRETERFVHVVS